MDSPADADSVRARKGEHLDIALRDAGPSSAGWDDISLVHNALPHLDLADVDLSAEFLGSPLRAPVIVAGMTGGHAESTAINAILARAAQRHGIALGVGSQRAALLDPTLEDTYTVTREEAPDAFLIGNIGAAQLVDQPSHPALTLDDIERAIGMIAANALAIHLNFLEELVQPEGERCASGCSHAISHVASHASVPILAKETGAGLSRTTAMHLATLGVAGLDVGGVGGTNFALIERTRAKRQHNDRGVRLGTTFAQWGIPTAVSIIGARAADIPLIATGGVRSGLDAAKALALGATAVGIGRPLLAAALEGDKAVAAWIEGFTEELRAAMWLAGCRRPSDLASSQLVIGGGTRRWLDDLHYRASDRR